MRAALAFMGLADSADKLVREYSGGMIRRLEITQLTYEVDALRTLMLAGGASVYGLGLDFGVLLAATACLILKCTSYSRQLCAA